MLYITNVFLYFLPNHILADAVSQSVESSRVTAVNNYSPRLWIAFA